MEGQWGLRSSGTPLDSSVETSPLRVGRLLEAGLQWGLEGYLLPDVPLVSSVPFPTCRVPACLGPSPLSSSHPPSAAWSLGTLPPRLATLGLGGPGAPSLFP